MVRKKTPVIPTITFGECMLPVEMSITGTSQIAIVRVQDEVLEAATRWLESASLTPEDRESIQRSTDDNIAKMAVFKHVLGQRRAKRLARNQDWLDEIQQRLMSDELMSKKADDPYWLLTVGQFLRGMQQDDTEYVQELSKKEEDLASARATIERQHMKSREDEATKLLQSIPPHQREKLRKMMEALAMPPKDVK